jgi:uncharacterized protein YdbL (DUF1318 family)
MKQMMNQIIQQRFLVFVVMLMVACSSWAIDLKSAKAQGLVGEANNGYLAAVVASPSADVKKLVSSVNAKRKAKFLEAANKTGATVEQVALRFYQRAVQQTAAGQYYQTPAGDWRKK